MWWQKQKFFSQDGWSRNRKARKTDSDEYTLEELTKTLDRLMSNASDNQQVLVTIVKELRQVSVSQH